MLSGKTEPLTRIAAYQQINVGKVGGAYSCNAAELHRVREVVLCLRYGVFVNLGSEVLFYLDSGLPKRNLAARHTIKKTKYV